MSSREALIKPRPKPRSKEQIIAALKSAARKLGHPPASVELHLLTGISRSQVVERFHGYRAAVFADVITTLCRFGIGFGIAWPLGHPWVTQGPPKRHARVTQGSIDVSSCICNKGEKWRVGSKSIR